MIDKPRNHSITSGQNVRYLLKHNITFISKLRMIIAVLIGVFFSLIFLTIISRMNISFCPTNYIMLIFCIGVPGPLMAGFFSKKHGVWIGAITSFITEIIVGLAYLWLIGHFSSAEWKIPAFLAKRTAVMPCYYYLSGGISIVLGMITGFLGVKIRLKTLK